MASSLIPTFVRIVEDKFKIMRHKSQWGSRDLCKGNPIKVGAGCPKSQFTVSRILGLDWPLIFWPHLFNILGCLSMIEKSNLLARALSLSVLKFIQDL